MTVEVPANLRPLIDGAINVARQQIESGGEIPGLAFIDTDKEKTGREAMVVIPMVAFADASEDGSRGKDAWARAVRTIGSYAGARFIMVVTECWYLGSDHINDFDAIIAEHGTLSKAPQAIEGVHVQLETHQAHWAGMAAITKTAEGKRTFGEIKLALINGSGRLFGLLTPKGTKQ